MNIKQVEELTGITKQNIRFYEKEELVAPKRNDSNGYREYDNEDVHRLLLIKMFRKLGMPLEEIGRVLNGEYTFAAAIKRQRESLEAEKSRLEAAIQVCRELETETPETFDVERTLARIAKEEAAGSRFTDIWNDFRMVAAAEEEKRFSFMPDIFIQTSRDFTDALLQYAKENDKDITITKEGMYPEFIMNGIEYSAYRHGTRFGVRVVCEMLYPEEADPAEMSEGRLKWMQMLYRIMQVVLVAALIGAPVLLVSDTNVWVKLWWGIGVGIACIWNCLYCKWRNKR